jgi:hypothetical protein
MKENDKRSDLDDLFRKKLEDPVDQPGYAENDWNALEQMLDKHKRKKGIVYWLPLLSGVAALFLLFFGWRALRPQVINHNSKNNMQTANHPKQANADKNGGATGQPTNRNQKTLPSVNYTDNLKAGDTDNLKPGKKSIGRKSEFAASATGAPRITSFYQKAAKDTTVNNAKIVLNRSEALFAENPLPVFELVQPAALTVNSVDLLKNHGNVISKPVPGNGKNKLKPVTGFHPQFALSVMAAPDINGVGSFQQSKLGTNEGLLFSAGISKKFTVSTGAIYSVKPYITAFENYHTPYNFPVTPVNVTADCRMLDIPLNLGYQLYNKQQNKISVGTGLSSYIMLHESYKFNYAGPYIIGPLAYTVPNSKKYFFGVLNLNATFERQLTSKVGLDVQPYIKLPLTNIGYSQVRLQTTGVAVALRWNLNSISNR